MTKAARLQLCCALLWLGCVQAPGCSQPPDEPDEPRTLDIQGHRGARGLLPENTLAAFERAIALGVTTLEMDLGVTRDGIVVVAHDPAINPALCLTSAGEPLDPPQAPLLRDLSVEEVQAYDCGSLNPDERRFPEPPRENRPGARIPTLSQVLKLAEKHPGIRFNVETKIDPTRDRTVPLENFVERVVSVLRAHDVVERTTLQSFDWRTLVLAKGLEPRLRTAALLAPDTLDPRWLAGLDPDDYTSTLQLLDAADAFVDDFSPYWGQLVPGPSYLGVPVSRYREAGFGVLPWTVNDIATMQRMIELGVDGIITDYPDRLLELGSGSTLR